MIKILCAVFLALVTDASVAAESVCSPSEAFGQKFGSGKVVGTVTSRHMNGVSYTPAEAIPPFHDFDAGITPRSQKIWSVSGVAQFESAKASEAYRARLIETFKKSLTVTEFVTTRLGVTEIYTGSKGSKDTNSFGETKFYHTDGLKIEISMYTDATNLSVKCSDLVLERLHISEVMAR